MHVDRNMHVIGCNMHVTCTLFLIGWLSSYKHVPCLAYDCLAGLQYYQVCGAAVHESSLVLCGTCIFATGQCQNHL